jgi:hypothetical protein
MPKGDVFSDPSFFYERAQLAPYEGAYTCSAITRRLCGWLGAQAARKI